MDIDKLIAANKRFDEEFEVEHPRFVAWWHGHLHCDKDPKFSVPARVAFKCQLYQDEFLESRQYGAA